MTHRIALIYFVAWFVTWPAMLADLQSISYSCATAKRDARQDLGFAMLWAAFPPAWIIAPFATGFYEHGFQFSTTRAGCEQ